MSVPPTTSSNAKSLQIAAILEASSAKRVVNSYLFPTYTHCAFVPSAVTDLIEQHLVSSRDGILSAAANSDDADDAESKQTVEGGISPPPPLSDTKSRPFLRSEQVIADWIGSTLQTSWEHVEDAQTRSTSRRAFITEALPAVLRAEYSKLVTASPPHSPPHHHNSNRSPTLLDQKEGVDGDAAADSAVPAVINSYWSDAVFRRHFNLTSILDDDALEGLDGSSAEALAEAVAVSDAGGSGGDKTAFIKRLVETLNTNPRRDVITKKKTTATSSSSNSSSKQQRHLIKRTGSHYAPLRRCFTNLLQNRDKFPKEMTLLFQAIERLQPLLTRIEESMDQCLLHIPLYRPLQRIALCIVRDLSAAAPGVAVTEQFTANNYEVLVTLARVMQDLYRYYEVEVSAVPAAATAAKGQLGSSMWCLLLTELEARKAIHDKAIQYIRDALAAEGAQQEDLATAVSRCEEEVRRMFGAMLTDAEAITAAAKETARRVDEVSQKAQSIYEHDKTSLESQIREATYRANASAEAQVKILRNIRQLYKSLEKEQAVHTNAVCDVVSSQVSLAKTKAAYTSFSAVAQHRKTSMKNILDACDSADAMLRETQSLCEGLQKDMAAHVSRSVSAETARKCVATRVAVDNIVEWRRVVGDLARLYQHIDDEVSLRKTTPITAPDGTDMETTTTSSSWQLDFLLSNARRIAAEKLQFIKTESQLLEGKWSALEEQFAAPFEVAMPARHAVDDDATVIANRRLLIEMEVARKYMRTKEVPPFLIPPSASSASSSAATTTPSSSTAGDNSIAATPSSSTAGDNSIAATPPFGELPLLLKRVLSERGFSGGLPPPAEEPSALPPSTSATRAAAASSIRASAAYPLAGAAPTINITTDATTEEESNTEAASAPPNAKSDDGIVSSTDNSPTDMTILKVKSTLRDASLAALPSARTILPVLAKFEAEMAALNSRHGMKNTSDYSKKSNKMGPTASAAGAAEGGATASPSPPTVLATSTTNNFSATPLTQKLQLQGARNAAAVGGNRKKLDGEDTAAAARAAMRKVDEAMAAAGTAAAMLRSTQRRASQSAEEEGGDEEGVEGEVGEGREGSPPAPPPPPRAFTTFAERSAAMASSSPDNTTANPPPIVPRPPPRR